MVNIKDKIKNRAEEIKKEVRQRISGYILTAFGLVAALAWNDAIKSLIEYFPLNKNTVLLKFIYAILITVIIVIISIYLTKFLEERKK